ncbi:MAG TPA: 2,3-bisphosphoglycerate-dependent phosphoglycerate mutase [Candidatus Saccharimonadales bacterium]|nr:2,3-bisphosphoglycerate-dependent phosphoglycerate mutase [Candidatus Saccharimonadales bacterium]
MSQTNTTSGKLILVRHAESEWNALGLWTGQTDVNITEKGQKDAAKLGGLIKDLDPDFIYTSEQVRTQQTLKHLLTGAEKPNAPAHKPTAQLNERHYGEYTGKNKWEVQKLVGDEMFTGIRRGWEHPIPGGETMKMVYERAVPFYKDAIVPQLLAGNTVLVVSHGNTIRSLIKYLENISDEGIADVEMTFDQILIYEVDQDGRNLSKEVRKIEIEPSKA